MTKDYDNAISNLKSAINLDFKGNSDQQDMLKTELAKCTNLEKEKEKIRIEKLQKAYANNLWFRVLWIIYSNI